MFWEVYFLRAFAGDLEDVGCKQLDAEASRQGSSSRSVTPKLLDTPAPQSGSLACLFLRPIS